jgi:hypothetical protein
LVVERQILATASSLLKVVFLIQQKHMVFALDLDMLLTA